MNGLRLQRNCSASPKLLLAVLGGVSAWTLLIDMFAGMRETSFALARQSAKKFQ